MLLTPFAKKRYIACEQQSQPIMRRKLASRALIRLVNACLEIRHKYKIAAANVGRIRVMAIKILIFNIFLRHTHARFVIDLI